MPDLMKHMRKGKRPDNRPGGQRVVDLSGYCVSEHASCGIDCVQVLLILLGQSLLQLLGAVFAQTMAQTLLNLLEDLSVDTLHEQQGW